MYLAENLKYFREKRGLSQKAFAEIMGVSSSAIGMWENDKRQPDIATLIRISEFFDETIDVLVKCDMRPPIPVYAMNIRYLRKKYGMSQTDMAKLLGYSGKQSCSSIETGKTKASVDDLEKLADYFGITLDQLVKQDLSKESEPKKGER